VYQVQAGSIRQTGIWVMMPGNLIYKESRLRMKRIDSEIKKNYILFGICMILFVSVNLYITVSFVSRYTEYLDNYRQINHIAIAYHDSQTYFHLYNKEREAESYDQYQAANEEMEALLSDTEGEMLQDRDCQMMLRVVRQMLEHRKDIIWQYLQPEAGSPQANIDYIENLDLLLGKNLNLLTTYYLDFISQAFSRYANSLKTQMLIINLALAGMGMFMYLFNTFIFKRLLVSVEKLTGAAIEIKNQNFDSPDIDKDRYEELNVVVQTFNDMKHTIRDMIEEINRNFEIKEKLSEQMLENERQQRRLAESKMKELQMQINPHFLFNTLSLVIRSVQLGEKETSITLIKAISKILRSSIETHALSIPLDDEIELLESYIYIQKIHCKGRIAIQLDVRKSYANDDVMVPPLIIQPLVENAIKHGLEDVVSDGRVSVVIAEKPQYILVTVKDNGCGLSDEVLENLKSHVATKSIGLLNVMERLQLTYHREDVMTVESSSQGTTVTLFLYKQTEEAYDTGNDSGR